MILSFVTKDNLLTERYLYLLFESFLFSDKELLGGISTGEIFI